ncbi:hypothetical protein U6G28_08810 [Actinomycetaceae bacterium MB13-C1-2]|nr:hypothetical protein U6G28_08810 [Actinomycetaceae bacterium MB13-C1-2]
MKTLYCSEYPELLVIKPRVVFVDHYADNVSDEDADILLGLGLGIVESVDGVAAVHVDGSSDESETDDPNGAEDNSAGNPVMLSKNATTAEWVTFMAENKIKHPEGATRKEMIELAEQHFAETE